MLALEPPCWHVDSMKVDQLATESLIWPHWPVPGYPDDGLRPAVCSTHTFSTDHGNHVETEAGMALECLVENRDPNSCTFSDSWSVLPTLALTADRKWD